MSEAKSTRIAAVLVIVGSAVEIVSLYRVTPITFLVFTMVSVPLVLAGLGVYVLTVLRVLRRTGGL